MSLPGFIKGNAQIEHWERLLALRGQLVPFVGAGFSRPLCPGWGAFLEDYRDRIAGDFFDEDDHRRYDKAAEDGDFEAMANVLFAKTRGPAAEDAFQASFGKQPDDAMRYKLRLFHRAFPAGWKLTTNFDRLLQYEAPDPVHAVHGNRPEDLEAVLDKNQTNALLQIHGGLDDSRSIILTSTQYKAAYGHGLRYDVETPLPELLHRIFTNHSLLFIGCSLETDRTLMILDDLEAAHPHFALMKREKDKKKHVALNTRLNKLGIRVIWFGWHDMF